MEKYFLTFVRGSGSVWVHLSTILRVQVWFRFTEVKFCWFRFGSGSSKWNGSFGFTVRVQVRFDTLPKTTKCFYFPNLTKSFVFDAITKEEVLVQTLQLNSNKASDTENIPIKFLRALATIISPYLSNIFIICFICGTFSATLKNAKIIPIHKARQEDVASNYKAISLISLLSNVFEKLL